MARKSKLAGIPIGPLVIFIIGIIAIIVILRNKQLFNFGPVAAPVAGTGNRLYPDANPAHECNNISDGEIEQDGDRREPQIACGFDFLNVEATVYINVHGVNDTLSVKLRGPKHSGIPDADMCNNIHYVNLGNSNTSAFGKQAGHTAEYCNFGDPIPAIPDNTWVGVKAVEWNEGSGVHFQTFLSNPEGSEWVLVADAVDNGGSGDCDGPASEAYTTSPCQDVGHPVSTGFRVDGLSGGGDVEFKCMSVREIVGGAAPNTTASVCTATSSTPTPTPTTPPAEEDEDSEDDEDDDDDGADPAFAQQQRDLTRQLNNCSGLTGETYRSCVNSAAAVSPRRRGNLAKRPVTRAMLSAYSPNYFKLRKKIRVGNIG